MTPQDLADILHLLYAWDGSPTDRKAQRRIDEWFGHFGPELIAEAAHARGLSLRDLWNMPPPVERRLRRLAIEDKFADKEIPNA